MKEAKMIAHKQKRDGNVNVRVNKKAKEQAELILSSYGLTLGDAINILISQVIRLQGVPFDLKPNAVTLAALNDVRGEPNAYDLFNLEQLTNN